jgi:cation transport ATPase
VTVAMPRPASDCQLELGTTNLEDLNRPSTTSTERTEADTAKATNEQDRTTIIGMLFLTTGCILMVLAWVPREEAFVWVQSTVFRTVLMVAGLGMWCLGTAMWTTSRKWHEDLELELSRSSTPRY